MIARLKVDSSEYDSKIKRAAQGLQHYVQSAHDSGDVIGRLLGNTKKYVESLGNMATVSTTARGRLNELTAAFTDLRSVYNSLSEEEKNAKGGFGQTLNKQLEILKQRINDTKNELKGIDQELGNTQGQSVDFKSILGELGSQFGINSNLINAATTGTIAYTAAIGAAASAVAIAAKEWAAYNQELAKQDQITTVTTGLQGGDAENMTSSMRALSRTYDVDFREAVNAANTLMTQFGVTGDEAIQLLRDGMQGMIMGDGPKLLSMIQQYAPAFQSAGISASQLVAIIQNSEGGIFTDQNMQAIIMGLANVRNMTKQTTEALAGLGIDGKKMSKDIHDGTITVFEALKLVSGAIDANKGKTEEVGAVMQSVFGRQARTAGDNLGKAIATLNTNLEETKRQTGELGNSLDDLYKANRRLETAIRDAFGYDGWQTMANGIKTELITALANVLELTTQIKDSVVGQVGGTIFESMASAASSALGPLGNILSFLNKIRGAMFGGSGEGASAGAGIGGAVSGALGSKANELPEVVVYGRNIKGDKGKGGAGVDKDEFTEIIGLIGEAQERVNDLQQRISHSWDEGEITELKSKLKDAQKELKRLQDLGSEPILTTGISGFNEQTMQAWMQMQQGRLSKTEFGSTEYSNIMSNIVDMNTIKTLLEESIKTGIDVAELDLAPLWEKVFDEENIPDEVWVNLQEKINEKLKEMGIEPINLDLKTGKLKGDKDEDKESGTEKLLKNINKLSGGLNSIASGLSSFGIELPKEISAAINVISGVGQIISGVQAVISLFSAQDTALKTQEIAQMTVLNGELTVLNSLLPELIAAAAIPFFQLGGIVHAAQGFSGTVPGMSYSGDNIPIMANAGEVVLTRAQAGVTADAVSGGSGGGGVLYTEVSGDALRIILDRNSRKRSKGKYMTTKMNN